MKYRYFYHFGYYEDVNHTKWKSTNELLECTKDQYEQLNRSNKMKHCHRPVRYIDGDIPEEKKIIRSLT